MPPDPLLAPGYITPFRAWRCWGVRFTPLGIRLTSAGGTVWPTDGPLEAECHLGHGHTAPAETCTCGVYGLLEGTPYYEFDGDYRVFGQVALYGVVVRGTRGFRAQRARPTGLFVSHKDWRLCGPLREAYRVPVRLVDPYTFETKEDPK